jgi:hypothetical protein
VARFYRRLSPREGRTEAAELFARIEGFWITFSRGLGSQFPDVGMACFSAIAGCETIIRGKDYGQYFGKIDGY